MFVWLIKIDTPRYYIMTSQIDKAKQAISKIYNIGRYHTKLKNILKAE